MLANFPEWILPTTYQLPVPLLQEVVLRLVDTPWNPWNPSLARQWNNNHGGFAFFESLQKIHPPKIQQKWCFNMVQPTNSSLVGQWKHVLFLTKRSQGVRQLVQKCAFQRCRYRLADLFYIEMAGDFTISWLGQPFPTHHSSQQRWTTESKMILRICMAHCTSQTDWKVPSLDIHPHISWSAYVDINMNCRCWQWWRRVKKLANLSTRKQWLVTHVFSWKQTKDLAFMTLISLLSNTKSGCRNPFHGNLCKTHQRMERWKKLWEYLRVN